MVRREEHYPGTNALIRLSLCARLRRAPVWPWALGGTDRNSGGKVRIRNVDYEKLRKYADHRRVEVEVGAGRAPARIKWGLEIWGQTG